MEITSVTNIENIYLIVHCIPLQDKNKETVIIKICHVDGSGRIDDSAVKHLFSFQSQHSWDSNAASPVGP